MKLRYFWPNEESLFYYKSAYLDNIAHASAEDNYLLNVGLTHVHSVLFPSDRNETEVLQFPFWLNIFGKISVQIKTRKLLKIEISIWGTLNSTVSYYMLVKDV